MIATERQRQILSCFPDHEPLSGSHEFRIPQISVLSVGSTLEGIFLS